MRKYLLMTGLNQDLPVGCECELGPAEQVVASKALIPIRRLQSKADLVALEAELGNLYSAQFTGKLGRLADAFTMTVSEMCDNATSHGRSTIGSAYVTAWRQSQKECVLAIGDLGVGIPEHIRNVHPELTADDDAIREATKEGVTGTRSEHRGIGYQCVIDELKDTEVPYGELRVWSGRGRFRVEVNDGVQVRRRAWPVEEWTAGTWVRLALSA